MTKVGHSKPVVGLAGGIGAGKSTVASILGELGAALISSDQLNRLELSTPEVCTTLVSWWGESVRTADGQIDRRKVAERVFANEDERLRLERLLHPRIAARRSMLMADAERDPAVRMVVLDSPLLIETGLDRDCDAVIFVEAPEAQREQRSEKARHWDAGELKRRESRQYPLDMKRARADHIVYNHSSLADLRDQVEMAYAAILADFDGRR